MDSREDRVYKSELKVNLKSSVDRCSVCQNDLSTSNYSSICSFCQQNQLKSCSICQKMILDGKFICLKDKQIHVDCFRCSICSKDLSTQTNIREIQSKIVCLECFTDEFASECVHCHQSIIDGKSIEFHGNKYHQLCFVCCFCKKLIDDERVHSIQSKPCCQICYRTNILPKCVKCSQPIEDQQIIYRDNRYHQQCFTCSLCQQTIQQKQFPTQNGNPFCSNCYQTKILPKCFKCSKTIEDQQSTIFQGNKFHQQCFTCIFCQQVMTESTFYTVKDEPCCSPCYQSKVLPKCSKCSKAIDSKYKKYGNEVYHVECFTCSICKKIIENNDKFGVDEQSNLRCSKCFI